MTTCGDGISTACFCCVSVCEMLMSVCICACCPPHRPHHPSNQIKSHQAEDKVWADLSVEMSEVALLVAEGIWEDLLQDAAHTLQGLEKKLRAKQQPQLLLQQQQQLQHARRQRQGQQLKQHNKAVAPPLPAAARA